tara:strand:+ start:273 stop:902 length:630 start_codon:yes stop_codon:yes gene_type:complete
MDDFRGKFWVHDDIIDKEYQERIKNKLLSHETNWFYNHNININSDMEPRPCFSHKYFDSEYDLHSTTGSHYHELHHSYLHDMLMPLIDTSCKSINYNYRYIIQGRSFLQLPLKELSDKLDIYHVDREENHLVILYYVKDSDGDTIIYKNRHQSKIKYSVQGRRHEEQKLVELQRVSPKQGRVVIFDGAFYHTAEQPQKDVRLIINYNVI